jgi:hypothetical protein
VGPGGATAQQEAEERALGQAEAPGPGHGQQPERAGEQPPGVDPLQAIALWRSAGEARDAAAAVSALSEDVRLVSPLTDRFVFTGRAQVRNLLEVALEAIDCIVYTDQVVQGSTAAVFYEGRLGGRRLHEAQLLRLDSVGLISEISLFVRPLPALTALLGRLGPELARRNGQPVLARVIPVAGVALHTMAVTGEDTIMPRAAPR